MYFIRSILKNPYKIHAAQKYFFLLLVCDSVGGGMFEGRKL